jgi:hypothetical protein
MQKDFDLTKTGCSSSDEHSWSTLDVNNDKKPDMAVTGICFDPNVGQSQWRFYVNQR